MELLPQQSHTTFLLYQVLYYTGLVTINRGVRVSLSADFLIFDNFVLPKFQLFLLFSAYFAIFTQFHTVFPYFLSVVSHIPELNKPNLCYGKQHRHFINWIIVNNLLSHDKCIQ